MATVQPLPPSPPDQGDRPLTLAQAVADLIADNMVPREEAEKLVANRRFSKSDAHPLVVIADQKWKDPRNPRKLLGLETLMQWLAEKSTLPYLHIDPFKIDFTAVTKVMSNAYAARYKILPIAVNTREATIATADPGVRSWEASLKQVLRLDIKRVVANPVDIQGYIVEFYNLARSVKGATDKDKGSSVSDIANFEQLVQLGRSGQLDANDQHIVHICDWLFNYAFEQRASDIHIEPRREVGNVRFRIDGALHLVYQIPTPVMAAMTSRIKILGRMDVVEKRRPQDGRLKSRAAAVDHAHRIRRKAGDADLQPGKPGQGLPRTRIFRRGRKKMGADLRRPARHHPRHRPHRLGQNNDVVFDAEKTRRARRQCLHHRRPDRDGRAQLQPDAGAIGDRRSASTLPPASAR